MHIVFLLYAFFILKGEVPEWLNGAVSKTAILCKEYRGFKSRLLRHKNKKYFIKKY